MGTAFGISRLARRAFLANSLSKGIAGAAVATSAMPNGKVHASRQRHGDQACKKAKQESLHSHLRFASETFTASAVYFPELDRTRECRLPPGADFSSISITSIGVSAMFVKEWVC